MKKITALFLSLILLLSLVPFSASAAYDSSKIAVEIKTPESGEKPAKAASKNVILSYTDSTGTHTLPDTAYTVETHWFVKGSQSESAVFEGGKTYTLTLNIILGMGTEFEFSSATVCTVNGSQARGNTLGDAISITRDFDVAAKDFTPSVTISTTDETTKTYDGKNITLTATPKEKQDGISYRYEWFKDGKAVKKDSEKLQIKNVADSGAYTCTLIASDGREERSTSSNSITVKITPAPITVTIADAQKKFGADDPEFTYMITGNTYDAMQGSLGRKEGEESGDYDIVIGTLAFPEEIASNYTVTVMNGKLTIQKPGTTYRDLPSVPDQSKILGENSTRISIAAIESSFSDSATLSLSPVLKADWDEIASLSAMTVLKAFKLELIDEDGKSASLASHGSLRISVPLTKEEAENASIVRVVSFDAKNRTLAPISATVEVMPKASYLVFETKNLSAFALIWDESEIVPATSGTQEEPLQKEKNHAWVWVLSIFIALLAAGGITFSVIWMQRRKNTPILPEEVPQEEEEEEFSSAILSRRKGGAPPLDEVYSEKNDPPMDEMADAVREHSALPSEEDEDGDMTIFDSASPKMPEAPEDRAEITRISIPVTPKKETPETGEPKKKIIFFDDLD